MEGVFDLGDYRQSLFLKEDDLKRKRSEALRAIADMDHQAKQDLVDAALRAGDIFNNGIPRLKREVDQYDRELDEIRKQLNWEEDKTLDKVGLGTPKKTKAPMGTRLKKAKETVYEQPGHFSVSQLAKKLGIDYKQIDNMWRKGHLKKGDDGKLFAPDGFVPKTVENEPTQSHTPVVEGVSRPVV